MTEKKCIDWKTDVARFEAYLREQESAEATVSKYLRDIRTFMTFVREQAWIEKNDILRYKDWLMEHYSVSSANSMIVALNQFLIFMEAGRMRVRRIRVQAQSFCSAERELEKEEFRRLVCRARAGGPAQLAMLMETICATGIRVSELKFFQAGSVRAGAVRVWNKGKYRIVLLPEKLRKKLLAYMAKYGIESGPLFCTRSGKAKDRSNIWREMKSLAAGGRRAPGESVPPQSAASLRQDVLQDNKKSGPSGGYTGTQQPGSDEDLYERRDQRVEKKPGEPGSDRRMAIKIPHNICYVVK